MKPSDSLAFNARLESRSREPGARELGFFEGARAGVGALFSDVSGAEAGVIKIFGSSSSYPIIEKM